MGEKMEASMPHLVTGPRPAVTAEKVTGPRPAVTVEKATGPRPCDTAGRLIPFLISPEDVYLNIMYKPFRHCGRRPKGAAIAADNHFRKTE